MVAGIYSWSSSIATPTHTKIDHIFFTKDRELTYPHCHLNDLSSSMSDHCTFLLTCDPFARRYKGFRSFLATVIRVQAVGSRVLGTSDSDKE
jgi:hypothetical protein